MDYIIEEIRKIRREIEAECDNDMHKYILHLLEVQKKLTGRLVSGKPRLLKVLEVEKKD